jgi:hypothetical protein
MLVAPRAWKERWDAGKDVVVSESVVANEERQERPPGDEFRHTDEVCGETVLKYGVHVSGKQQSEVYGKKRDKPHDRQLQAAVLGLSRREAGAEATVVAEQAHVTGQSKGDQMIRVDESALRKDAGEVSQPEIGLLGRESDKKKDDPQRERGDSPEIAIPGCIAHA